MLSSGLSFLALALKDALGWRSGLRLGSQSSHCGSNFGSDVTENCWCATLLMWQECGWVRDQVRWKGTFFLLPSGIWGGGYLRLSCLPSGHSSQELLKCHDNHETRSLKRNKDEKIKNTSVYCSNLLSNMVLPSESTVLFIVTHFSRAEWLDCSSDCAWWGGVCQSKLSHEGMGASLPKVPPQIPTPTYFCPSEVCSLFTSEFHSSFFFESLPVVRTQLSELNSFAAFIILH